MRAVTRVCPETDRAERPTPAASSLKLVNEKKSRSWAQISVGIFRSSSSQLWHRQQLLNRSRQLKLARLRGTPPFMASHWWTTIEFNIRTSSTPKCALTAAGGYI